jgi:hypothetical protein
VVGDPPIQLEPDSHILNPSPLLSPPTFSSSSDSFCDSVPFPIIPESTAASPVIIDSAPVNDCPVVDFSDMTDSELEKMLLPFSVGRDSSFDPDYFDLESFMAA